MGDLTHKGHRLKLSCKVGKGGGLYSASAGFAAFYDCPRASLKGKSWLGLAGRDEKPLLEKALGRAQEGKMVRVETVSNLNGRRRAVSWLFRPLAEREVAAEGTELTELDARERRLVKAAKMAVLTDTVTALAHEFAQPLNIMNAAVSNALLALKAGDGDKVAEKLRRIATQVKRTASLVESVRNLETIGKRRYFMPLAAVRRVVASFREPMAERGINLILRSQGVVGVRVFGSAELFELLLTNLLVNAEEAVMASPPPGKITVSLLKTASLKTASLKTTGGVRLKVRDNGIGIAAKDRNKLFEPFFTTKQRGGHGLGLAMVYNIAAHMGGNARLTAAKDGAEFEVTLPTKTAGKTARAAPS